MKNIKSCADCQYLKPFMLSGKAFYCGFRIDTDKIPIAFNFDNPEFTREEFYTNCPTWKKKGKP